MLLYCECNVYIQDSSPLWLPGHSETLPQKLVPFYMHPLVVHSVFMFQRNENKVLKELLLLVLTANNFVFSSPAFLSLGEASIESVTTEVKV